MGRSAASAAVEVAKAERALVSRLMSWRWRAWRQPASLAVGRGLRGEIIYVPIILW